MSISNLFPDAFTNANSYVPTVSDLVQVTSVTSPIIRYIRMGSTVHCQFFGFMTSMAGTPSSFSLTLPIDRSSNFTNQFDCNGLIMWADDANPIKVGIVNISAGTKKIIIQVPNSGVNAGAIVASFAYSID